MSQPFAPPANRNPLDVCIDDAVSHGGVLMAELVARARKSLYELAHRSGQGDVVAAIASQARQLLAEKSDFFENEFPGALLTAMRNRQMQSDRSDDSPTAVPAFAAWSAPFQEFAALASGALGFREARLEASPISPETVARAVRSVAERTGVNEAVRSLWMEHLSQALGPELAAEYRRLSGLLRQAGVTPSATPVATAPAAGLPGATADASGALRAAAVSPAGAAQRIAADIASWPEIVGVPESVREFVMGPWSDVIAQAQSHTGSSASGANDPDGYFALVKPLFWSAQPTLGKADVQRLLITMPSLLSRLRSGLQSIGYPAEQASAFFRTLEDLHGTAVSDASGSFATRREPRQAETLADGALPAPMQATAVAFDENAVPVSARVSAAAASLVLEPGVRLAVWQGGHWEQWELVWASPKGRLLLFSTESGGTESMSRAGCIRRIIEQRMHLIPDFTF
ncbi:DUF1631 family protein [Xylophilus sp. Kf1]|nr:DUF1631 family protein [Xylophilus sp. Kf1]